MDTELCKAVTQEENVIKSYEKKNPLEANPVKSQERLVLPDEQV